MDPVGFWAVLFLLGLAVGFLAGLSGIGGAVLLAPALLLVVPRLGGPILSGPTVASLDMAQAFSAGLAATPVYWRDGAIDPSLIRFMGGAAVLGGALGALSGPLISSRAYLFIFLGLTVLGVVSLAGREGGGSNKARPPGWPVLAAILGLAVSFCGSLAGSSGSFLLSPAATRILHVPIRRAVGSVMTVVMVGAAANLAGRVIWTPFPWWLAGLVSVPASQAARFGARAALHAPNGAIRVVLGALLLGASILLSQKLLAR